MIELGSKVKDKITGFEGVVTGRTEWLTGCVRLAVQPSSLTKEGASKAEEWLDESRLDLVAKPTAKVRSVRDVGGPTASPRRSADPKR